MLPLYIVLMGVFPSILWLMLRRPNMTLAASALLYVMVRQFGWNFPAYPGGVWYFNPIAWQLLFTFGAWFALGGSAQAMPFIRSRTALLLGTAYLLFALVMTMAARFDELRSLIPRWRRGVWSLRKRLSTKVSTCCAVAKSRSVSLA